MIFEVSENRIVPNEIDSYLTVTMREAFPQKFHTSQKMEKLVNQDHDFDRKKTGDGPLMSKTFDRLGDLDKDIVPAIFFLFIKSHPETASLFRIIDPSQPPHGCGQMLFEILSVLIDNAEGKPYVDAYLRDLIIGHKAFGVHSSFLYDQFLTAIHTVISEQLGTQWPQAESEAWIRQTNALKERIRQIGHSCTKPRNGESPLTPDAAMPRAPWSACPAG